MPEQRALRRELLSTDAFVYVASERAERKCLMVDYSDNGARLQFDDGFHLPGAFLLRIPAKGQMRLAAIRWRHDDLAGVEFIEPESLTAHIEVLTAEIGTLRLRMDNLRDYVEERPAAAAAG